MLNPSRLLVCLGLAASGAGAAAPQADIPRVDALVVHGTNEFRREEGLAPLSVDERLEAAAQSFADFMAKTGRYGHEADGSTPFSRAKASGYDYCIVSENISYQYSSQGFATAPLARSLVDGWKNSPGHRKNMVDPDVIHIAVAVSRGPRNGYYYAVQMFGRPKSSAVEFQVRNAAGTAVRYRVGGQSFSLAPNAWRRHTLCREETVALDRELTAHNRDKFAIARHGNRISLERE